MSERERLDELMGWVSELVDGPRDCDCASKTPNCVVCLIEVSLERWRESRAPDDVLGIAEGLAAEWDLVESEGRERNV